MRPPPRNPSVRGLHWWRDAAAAAACLAAFLALASSPLAQSGSSFPSKPVRILVPYGPGGVGDLTMRLLAQRLTERTRRPFVIENRPGAGGSLSAKGVLESPADGYTLGVTGNGQAISMTLFKARTYDVLADFTQISVTAQFEKLPAVK